MNKVEGGYEFRGSASDDSRENTSMVFSFVLECTCIGFSNTSGACTF